MTTDGQIFFGAVLKAIACTPNSSADSGAYETLVIEPCKQIRSLAEEVGTGAPSEAQIRQTLSLLDGVFEAKGVEAQEQQERFQEILQHSHLPEALMPSQAR